MIKAEVEGSGLLLLAVGCSVFKAGGKGGGAAAAAAAVVLVLVDGVGNLSAVGS